jgi:DNA-binding SARP family transcriptional activator
MEFRILGPLEVIEDGRSVELGGQKQRALVALLLLEPNCVVSRDRLIEALWEDEPPDTAPKALQVHVSNIRKRLGRDRIATKPPGYAIRVEPGELDLDRFERLVEEGGRRRLAEALALWRGPPLADFARTRFAQHEIGRLEERRLTVLEQRIEADLAFGQHADLVAELESLVAEHPLREQIRALQMLALYRSGRQADALEAYQDARRVLVEELGIEPGRELRELHQTILRQDPVLELDRRVETVEVPDTPTGFVGRASELAELAAGLQDALAGRGRLFLIQGEPGIGKSRLADELMILARARGATVLAGRCWEAGGAPAYWPWQQSLRAYVRRAEQGALRRQLGEGAADVARIVPELRDLFAGIPEPEPYESEAARSRLFGSTASFLVSAASVKPLVLVLDDLHAADEPSLMLLRFVASALADSRLLIVATSRDLDPALTELGRGPVGRPIHLSGLDEQEVGELAEATAQAEAARRLSAELYSATKGNPLFVLETVRLLAAEHLLSGATEPTAIPQTVREAIGLRLRYLSGECRRVLSLASVFGHDFGLVGLERVADYTGIDKLVAVLDEAIAARVAEEISGAVGRLRFGHALMRDALYEEIPAVHRERLHRRVGEVLEGLYSGNPEPHLAELAHHFSLAVPAAAPDKAIDYAKRAGDRAVELLAFEEAARLYGLALDLLDVAPDARLRGELLRSLGEAQAYAATASSLASGCADQAS